MGMLANREPGPRMDWDGEPPAAHGGQEDAVSTVPTGSATQHRAERLPPWVGLGAAWLLGLWLWEGPPGEGCRVGAWGSLAGWGVPESPLVPRCQAGCFPVSS